MKKEKTDVAPKSMTELRDQLCDVFARVQKDSAFVPIAHEAANAAGKIITSVSVQMYYQRHIGNMVEIPFVK